MITYNQIAILFTLQGDWFAIYPSDSPETPEDKLHLMTDLSDGNPAC